MRKKKHTLMGGKLEFGSLESKEAWILEGILGNLDYIGKESNIKNLSYTERELIKLSKQQLRKLIKSKRIFNSEGIQIN